MKIEREDDKESTCKLYRVLKTVTKSGPRFLAQGRLWTMEHILPDLLGFSDLAEMERLFPPVS